MKPQSIFLLVAVVGLTPIALSYGYAPVISLNYLFEIDASPINVTHIFRAVMGLVFGSGVILGAWRTVQKVSTTSAL